MCIACGGRVEQPCRVHGDGRERAVEVDLGVADARDVVGRHGRQIAGERQAGGALAAAGPRLRPEPDDPSEPDRGRRATITDERQRGERGRGATRRSPAPVRRRPRAGARCPAGRRPREPTAATGPAEVGGPPRRAGRRPGRPPPRGGSRARGVARARSVRSARPPWPAARRRRRVVPRRDEAPVAGGAGRSAPPRSGAGLLLGDRRLHGGRQLAGGRVALVGRPSRWRGRRRRRSPRRGLAGRRRGIGGGSVTCAHSFAMSLSFGYATLPVSISYRTQPSE